jgi:acyl-CoA thioesterase FadM
MFARTLFASWADMDFNSHMKNTAYLDKAADVRQMYLMENGFPVEEFSRLRIGPVVMKDEVEYCKEVGLQQKITVTYALADRRFRRAAVECQGARLMARRLAGPVAPTRQPRTRSTASARRRSTRTRGPSPNPAS